MVKIGSARHDENGKYSGGKAGDQTGQEVAEQSFYIHRKGWYILRPISTVTADMIGERMYKACGNPNIGYDQNQRGGIYLFGTATTTPTECDCSTLVCQILREVLGTKVPNFTTANEIETITRHCSKDFTLIAYSKGDELYKGDILVTKTKGHTAIVTSSDWSRHSEGFETDKHRKKPFTVGTNYTLQVELKVREGAGTNYRAKTHNELTSGGKSHDKDKDGALDKGTVVTCKEVKQVGNDTWIKCPSGWIAAIYNGKTYVK